jgi:hypothetical protein
MDVGDRMDDRQYAARRTSAMAVGSCPTVVNRADSHYFDFLELEAQPTTKHGAASLEFASEPALDKLTEGVRVDQSGEIRIRSDDDNDT